MMTSIGNISPMYPKVAMRPGVPQLRFAAETPPSGNTESTSGVLSKEGWLKGKMRILLLGLGLVGTNAAVTGAGMMHSSHQNQQLRTDMVALETVTEAQKKALADFQAEVLKGNKSVNEILADMRISVHSVEAINRVAKAGVRIEGSRALGSGTFFKDNEGNLYILTNGHVVDNNAINGDNTNHPRFKVRLYNGSDSQPGVEVEAELVKLSNGEFVYSPWAEGQDLAVLKVIQYPDRPEFEPPHFLTPADFRDLSKEPLQPGEAVFLVGTPKGFNDSVSPGFVGHAERETEWNSHVISIQSNAPSNPGNSGGAVYDAQGRWIGVHNSAYPNSKGLGYSIRIDSVLEFLNKNSIPVTPGTTAAEAPEAKKEEE